MAVEHLTRVCCVMPMAQSTHIVSAAQSPATRHAAFRSEPHRHGSILHGERLEALAELVHPVDPLLDEIAAWRGRCRTCSGSWLRSRPGPCPGRGRKWMSARRAISCSRGSATINRWPKSLCARLTRVASTGWLPRCCCRQPAPARISRCLRSSRNRRHSPQCGRGPS